ncbi:MAG: YdcF family protein [Deltaproteobacteria bacterium]|nr:YdcF family protein [Candidatus Anaeroferrophillacea bacterium]
MVKRALLALLLLGPWGVYAAHDFLAFDSSLPRADCVMVMLGGDGGARMRGGQALVDCGKAPALLVPARYQVLHAGGGGVVERADIVGAAPETRRPARPQARHAARTPAATGRVSLFGRGFRVYENTHLELLRGRRMMDARGYRSAVIVSSPYHMRRLQLIAHKVFGDDFRIGFAATPFEAYDVIGCYSSWANFRNVAGEYAKIGWFLVYSWFV